MYVLEDNEQEAILGKRNSYSKADPEATFMRIKDDHTTSILYLIGKTLLKNTLFDTLYFLLHKKSCSGAAF